VRAQSLKTFVRNASKARRDAAGRIIFRLVFTSIFRHHRFNCDPHPGNYLFGHDKVYFLDFGCVRQFEPRFIELWRGLMRSVLENDEGAHRTYLDALHISPRPERRKAFDYGYHMKVSRYLYRPWLTDEPFRYTPEYVKRSFGLLVSRNPNAMHMRLPTEFVFVNRLQWGLNSVLAALGAEARWREILLPLLYAPGEQWPEPLPPHILDEAVD
jgi:predicted unusual protein kinase regulating ubiquinone biosynthesis (AarF/ABC1/UbiB family)